MTPARPIHPVVFPTILMCLSFFFTGDFSMPYPISAMREKIGEPYREVIEDK
jgi:hypothetical protein